MRQYFQLFAGIITDFKCNCQFFGTLSTWEKYGNNDKRVRQIDMYLYVTWLVKLTDDVHFKEVLTGGWRTIFVKRR